MLVMEAFRGVKYMEDIWHVCRLWTSAVLAYKQRQCFLYIGIVCLCV